MCLPVSTFVSQLWTAVSASALQFFTFVSQRWAAVSAFALQSLILHLSPSSDCCVRLCLAILCMCPRKPLHSSPSSRLLYPPLPCNPLFVTQLWAACRLQSFACVSLCLHCLPALDCRCRLCLAILCLPALDVASFSCRVFRLFGVYGGVILNDVSCEVIVSRLCSLEVVLTLFSVIGWYKRVVLEIVP